MPPEMEDELVKKELEYAKKKFGITKESDLQETVFRIDFFGQKPVISVKSQQKKWSLYLSFSPMPG